MWRIIGRCASQQAAEQKNEPVRGRVQVETLHTGYGASKAIGVRQLEPRWK